MSDKVAVERNKADSTLGIIKEMTFQPQEKSEIFFKVHEVTGGMKKEGMENEYSQFLIREKIRHK